MKIKELKKRIAEMPDEMVVVTDSFDHSYRPVGEAEKVEAAVNKHRDYHEHFGQDYLNPGDKVVEVFRIN